MSDKIRLLEEKVGQVLDRLEALHNQNSTLREQNAGLKDKLAELQQAFDGFQVEHRDRAEQVKSKLATLLGRIEQLEQIGL